METHFDELEQSEQHGRGVLGFILGALLGGLAGAGAMLLMAPQSGQRTRRQIRHKGLELRQQTVTGIEDAVAQTKAKAGQITADVKEKAEEIRQRGQKVLETQLERVSNMVDTGQEVVRGNGAV